MANLFFSVFSLQGGGLGPWSSPRQGFWGLWLNLGSDSETHGLSRG